MLRNTINFILSFIILTTICVVPSVSTEITTSAKGDKKVEKSERSGPVVKDILSLTSKKKKVPKKKGIRKILLKDFLRKNFPQLLQQLLKTLLVFG